MGTKPTDMEMGKFDNILFNLREKVRVGTRDVDAVGKQLQMIADAKMPERAILGTDRPRWWQSPERLLNRLREISHQRGWEFINVDFPNPPEIALSGHRMLLPAVYLPCKDGVTAVQRTFDEHMKIIQMQLEETGCDFDRRLLKTDPDHLRLHSSRRHRPGIRWVIYNYAAPYMVDDVHPGRFRPYYVKDLWDDGPSNLAASEVLTAIMLMPGYGRPLLSGGPSKASDKALMANASGYQLSDGQGADESQQWHSAPFVTWYVDRPGNAEERGHFSISAMPDDGPTVQPSPTVFELD